jgi:hypothetical protein
MLFDREYEPRGYRCFMSDITKKIVGLFGIKKAMPGLLIFARPARVNGYSARTRIKTHDLITL